MRKRIEKNYRLMYIALGAASWFDKFYYLFCRYRLGVEEYWNYKFYTLKSYGRKKFVAGALRTKIYNVCNDKEARGMVFENVFEFVICLSRR